jgi:hypothetical protein
MNGQKTMELPNALARIAAVLFLIVVMLGITIELFVLPDILVPGDAAATINNLVLHQRKIAG